MLKIIYRIIVRIIITIIDKPLPPPSQNEKELVDELKFRFQNFSLSDKEETFNMQSAWLNNTRQLCDLILNDDPRRFLRWDIIQKSMFVTHPWYIQKELRYLRQKVDWGSKWKNVIRESQVGYPVPYPFFPNSSGNLIHHAYHLAHFEQCMDISIRDNIDFVLEFGGGYGSMCRLFHNLNFNGIYIIFDLPHFSTLQKFYLKSIGLNVLPSDCISTENEVLRDGSIICISELEKLRATLTKKMNSLYIATWSISEAPINVRKLILDLVCRFDMFLIAFQETFENINNIDYFCNWMKNTDDTITWDIQKIQHLPGDNYYLLGKREP